MCVWGMGVGEWASVCVRVIVCESVRDPPPLFIIDGCSQQLSSLH